MTKAKATRLHWYRHFRKAGYTAEAAFNSARAHIYFMETLRRDVASHKRRSRAATKAWKARRAKAA